MQASRARLRRRRLLPDMAIRVVEFSNGGYKIKKIFAQESTNQKEIIEF
jgi:hypothetical protein